MEHFLFRDLAALNVLFRDSLLVNRGQSLLFLRFILQVSVGATLKIDSSILSKAKGLVSGLKPLRGSAQRFPMHNRIKLEPYHRDNQFVRNGLGSEQLEEILPLGI